MSIEDEPILDMTDAEKAMYRAEYLERSNQTIENSLLRGIITIEQAELMRIAEFDIAHDLLFTTPESRSDGN